jgi:hypothetical protein
VALEANAQWKLLPDFSGKRAHHNTFDIHMKAFTTEDTLPVIAEKMQEYVNTFEKKVAFMKN